MKPVQLELFSIPPHQPSVRELQDIYNAVMRLRRAGFRVFRAGRDRHLIRRPRANHGWKVTVAELLRLASLI